MKKEEQKALQKAIFAQDTEVCKNILDNTDPLSGECTINDEIDGYGGSLLAIASDPVMRSDTSIVKILLEKGADPNAVNGVALQTAIGYPHNVAALRLLCDAGANVNIEYEWDERASLLGHIIDSASSNEHMEIIEILLKAGADPNKGVQRTFMLQSGIVHKPLPLLICCMRNPQLWGGDATEELKKTTENLCVKKLIDAGADLNAKYYCLLDQILGHMTPLYYAINMTSADGENINGTNRGILLVRQLLKAGADPSIPTHNSDTAFKLAIRLEKPELINAICSVLFQQDSLESLYNIVTLTLESLNLHGKIDDTLLLYYQKDDWKSNFKGMIDKHVESLHTEISKAHGKEREIFKDFINIPYKLDKLLKIIEDKSQAAGEMLSEKLPRSCLHEALSSMIRIYSKKYSPSFSDELARPDLSKPGISEDIKVSVISFLPLEDQWDTIMLSKGGLKDPWFPNQSVIASDSDCDQGIIGFQMPIDCNIM